MIKKFHFIFAFLLIGFCFACPSNTSEVIKTNSLKSLNGTWDLMSIQEDGRTAENPYGNRTVSLTFEYDESLGKITGNDICGNTVFGDYTLLPENALKIERFGGTKRGCDGWASNFWGLIQAATAYEVNEEQLKIFFNNDSNALIFKRKM